MPKEELELKKPSINRIMREVYKNGGMATVCLTHNADMPTPESQDVQKHFTIGTPLIMDAVRQMKAAAFKSKFAQSPQAESEKRNRTTKATSRKIKIPTAKIPCPEHFLNAPQNYVKSMNSGEKCGLCGSELAMGDIYVEINLAEYGCTNSTDKICLDCCKNIAKHLS